MGFSLGELFVTLGFDVDDEKLKSFNEGIKQSTNWMEKQAIAATGAVTALGAFVQTQADSAIHLRNLNSELNINTRAVQEWSNVVHQVNPEISVDQATESFKKLKEAMVDVSQGGGPSGTIARLANVNPVGMQPEDLLEAIARNKQKFIKENGPDGQAIWSSLMNRTAGLSSFSRAMDLDAEKRRQMAAPYIVDPKTLDNLTKFGDETAKLSEAMHAFTMSFAGNLAPRLTVAVDGLIASLNGLNGFNKEHPSAVGLETMAGVGLLGMVSKIATRIPVVGRMFAGGPQIAALSMMASVPWVASDIGNDIAGWIKGGGGGDAGKWLTEKSKRLMGNRSGGGSKITSSQSNSYLRESMEYWMAQGYTREQAAGLVANEKAESNGNPNAPHGDGGLASGIFQWHPDRVQNMLKATGIDVRRASHLDQLKAANQELMATGIGEKLRHITSADEAAQFISRKHIRPRDRDGEAIARGESAKNLVNMNIVQNIHTNDPKVAGAESARLIQQQNNAALPALNQGSIY